MLDEQGQQRTTENLKTELQRTVVKYDLAYEVNNRDFQKQVRVHISKHTKHHG